MVPPASLEDVLVARLFVPKSNRVAIKSLITLNQLQFDSLVSTLKHLPDVKGEPLRLSNITVNELSKADSEDILDTIETLYRIWSSRGNQSLPAFIDDLSDAILDFYPEGDSQLAKARLSTVLDIEPLARASKVLSVSTDHEHAFYDAKILSDIRYVFRPDPEAEPYGATIVQILKIVYHTERDHKAFFVALDGQDLLLLKKVIERAEKKTKQLREHLDAASVPFLGTGGR
jgi:hypothetical protein